MKMHLVYMLSLGSSSSLFLLLAGSGQGGSVADEFVPYCIVGESVRRYRGSPLLGQCNLFQLLENTLIEAAFFGWQYTAPVV